MEVIEAKRRAAADLERAMAEVAKYQAVVDYLDGIDAVESANGQAETAEVAAGTTAMATKMLFGRPVREVTLTELCLQSLRERGRSMNGRDISNWLASQGLMDEDGRPYDPARLRSTLKYLSRKKKIVQAGKPGLWKLPAPPKSVLVSPPGDASPAGDR